MLPAASLAGQERVYHAAASPSFTACSAKMTLAFRLCTFFLLALGLLLAGGPAQAQPGTSKSGSAPTWGDQGDGTYRNPILNADYSDPDVIRVGADFYLVCSDFHFMGIPVLHSKDLVNWTIVGQVYNRLDVDTSYNTMRRYGRGSWAPSLRYHAGRFWVYFCTPDEGVLMSSAAKAEGPWTKPVVVKRVRRWEDPCPFWDEDGQAYLGHSVLGAGPIILHKMSTDGTRLLDEGTTVYTGPGAEGTKIYKRQGYYYFVIPEGGVATGWQTVLRSKSLYGPFEKKVVLEQGQTAVNGPHQGGLVDLESGESWFIHFQDAGPIGRVAHLQPVQWVDGWPQIGRDQDGNGIGEPVAGGPKPKVGKGPYRVNAPQTGDEFTALSLGPQWQWNHNPVPENWSLTEKKGFLSLRALPARTLQRARNTATQKLMGRRGTITTRLDVSLLADGQRAGLCLLGAKNYEIGVVKTGGVLTVFATHNGAATAGPALTAPTVWLRVAADLDQATVLQYSLDGQFFQPLGGACQFEPVNFWKGVRPGLFSYNEKTAGGTALFDWFRYQYDGPAGNWPN